VNLADLHETAKRIFQPYVLNIADTFWWSAYMIGQRIVDHFHKDNRIFLTGDACHTHSPKAGQGMNVSLQDGYNIGWKLASVLKGRCSPQILETYSLERGKVALDLIEFDVSFAKLFSSANKDAAAGRGADYFASQFIKSGKYTAGLTATYDDSLLMYAKRSTQELAPGLVIGMRFPSTRVVRFADVKAMQLVKMLPMDGRWRIVVFGGNLTNSVSAERLQKVSTLISRLVVFGGN
jgi:phenol 2-monooxygenase